MKNKAKVLYAMYELWMLPGECGHNASYDVSSTSQKRPHTTNPLYQTYPIPRFGIHGGKCASLQQLQRRKQAGMQVATKRAHERSLARVSLEQPTTDRVEEGHV